MCKNENEEVTELIRWIRENQMIWDLMCGESWNDFTIGDYIEILEKLVADQLYSFAFILLKRINDSKYVSEAISNVIVNFINKPNHNMGVITECIEEIKIIANSKNAMSSVIIL